MLVARYHPLICGLQVNHDAVLVKQHTPALPALLCYVRFVSAV